MVHNHICCQILQIFVKTRGSSFLPSSNVFLNPVRFLVGCVCLFLCGPLDGSLTQQMGKVSKPVASCISVAIVRITLRKYCQTNKMSEVALKGNTFLSRSAAFTVLMVACQRYLLSSVLFTSTRN